jgi:PAS domain S-box-containing protein
MKTIMVIEDDKILRENTCDFLKEEGYNVISAEDGLIGLQQAIKNHPDLILCDIMMPNMNGHDFYKTIQQMKSTSSIPLIFLTAKTEKEDLRTGMNLGADDYITKPFDLNELLISVKTRLDKFEKIQEKSDEKFYTLIDNPLTGVFIYRDNKFVFVNEKFTKIFGYSKADFLAMPFEDLISSIDKKSVLEKIDHFFKNIQNTVHAKFQVQQNSGKQKILVEMFAGVVSYNGSDSMLGYITEIVKTDNKSHFSARKDKSAETLSKKELQILKMICQGSSNSEISGIFGRSIRTIETHRANIVKKTKVKNTADLVMYSKRNGLV